MKTSGQIIGCGVHVPGSVGDGPQPTAKWQYSPPAHDIPDPHPQTSVPQVHAVAPT
jgi:hypothetical protein